MGNSDKKEPKRIIALIGVILIIIMVLATLLTAFLDKSGVFFRSCLIVTIALPIALWVFLWAYGAMTNKHTVASVDLFGGEDNNKEITDEEAIDEEISDEEN